MPNSSAAMAYTEPAFDRAPDMVSRATREAELVKERMRIPRPAPIPNDNSERRFATERGQLSEGPFASRLVLPRVEIAPPVSFVPLQEWEGCVISVDEQIFRATLVDVTAGDEVETEEVELAISDVDPDERRNLKPGAIFRWTIGYQMRLHRPRLKGSQIVFRQMAKPQKSEIAAALKRGAERAKAINWD